MDLLNDIIIINLSHFFQDKNNYTFTNFFKDKENKCNVYSKVHIS